MSSQVKVVSHACIHLPTVMTLTVPIYAFAFCARSFSTSITVWRAESLELRVRMVHIHGAAIRNNWSWHIKRDAAGSYESTLMYSKHSTPRNLGTFLASSNTFQSFTLLLWVSQRRTSTSSLWQFEVPQECESLTLGVKSIRCLYHMSRRQDSNEISVLRGIATQRL